MGKDSLTKKVLDLIIIFVVVNEIAIYFYFRSTNSVISSTPPNPIHTYTFGAKNEELECALENVREMESLLKMTPVRRFTYPDKVRKILCITLGGEKSDEFRRVQLFLRVLGVDVEAFDAVRGEEGLIDAKYGNNTRTNFNLPKYMNELCSDIPEEKFAEYKSVSEKLFERLSVTDPNINDLIFATGKFNDLQRKKENPFYINNYNRPCFTGFLWSKLGCWQSHVLATREAEKAGVVTIILEEDVDVDAYFYDLIQNALNDIPRKWDILRIGSCLDPANMRHIKTSIYASGSHICNHGYIVNGVSGARRLLDIIDSEEPMEAYDTIMEENKDKYENYYSYTTVPYAVTQIDYMSSLKTKNVAGGIKNSVGGILSDILYLKKCDNCPNYTMLNYNYIITL